MISLLMGNRNHVKTVGEFLVLSMSLTTHKINILYEWDMSRMLISIESNLELFLIEFKMIQIVYLFLNS
jgi:hypothetical protein